MRPSWDKYKHLSVEILVTDFGEFPCPTELSTRSGIKLRKNNTPDRRTIKGRDWYRRFNEFCEQKKAEYLRGANS